MLKKIKKVSAGVFLWSLRVRMPDRQINNHITATEAGASKILADLLDEKARARTGLPYKPSTKSVLLGDAAARYESELLRLNKNIDHVTSVVRELGYLRQQLGDDFPLSHVNRAHLTEWRQQRGAMVYHKKTPSARTLNKCLSHLSAFFDFCSEWMEANPTSAMQNVREVKPALRSLLWADYCAFADAAWQRPCFGLLVELLGETGARVDEVMRAHVSDVDSKRRIWRKVVKPGKTLELDAGPWVLGSIKGRDKNEPLCPREDGARWTYTMIKKMFRATAQPYFSPHVIRHGRACWDLAEGKTVWDVKTKLGHSSIAITEKYLRAAELVKRAEKPGTIHTRAVSRLYPMQPFQPTSNSTIRQLSASWKNGSKSSLIRGLKCKSAS